MNSALRAGLSGCLAVLTITGCQREAATDAVPPKAADAQQTSATDIRSDPLRQAFFGELHLHTAYSLDAYIFGNTMNDPFVAYRFAQGEEVTLASGVKKRIRKPLDFAAVTDHAEALGEYELCTNASSAQYNSPICTGIRGGDLRPFGAVFAGLAKSPANRLADLCGEDGKLCRDAIESPWKRTQQAAAQNYKPGKFTTFVAWEFSANAPEGKFGMMHRNVIFRSDKVPLPVLGLRGHRRGPAHLPREELHRRLQGADDSAQPELLLGAPVLGQELGRYGVDAGRPGATRAYGSPGRDHADQGQLRMPDRHRHHR